MKSTLYKFIALLLATPASAQIPANLGIATTINTFPALGALQSVDGWPTYQTYGVQKEVNIQGANAPLDGGGGNYIWVPFPCSTNGGRGNGTTEIGGPSGSCWKIQVFPGYALNLSSPPPIGDILPNTIKGTTIEATVSATAPHFFTTDAGGLQLGGAATAGLFNNVDDIALRTPSATGSIYLQTSGGSAGATVFTGNLVVGGTSNLSGGAVTISPANANIVIAPTGTGTVGIFPVTTEGHINNVRIGDIDPANAAFVNTSMTGTPLINFTTVDNFNLRANVVANAITSAGLTYPYNFVANMNCVTTIGCTNFYSAIHQSAGAGSSWGGAVNLLIASGNTAVSGIVFELDLSNDSSTAAPTGLLIAGNIGAYPGNIAASIFPSALNGTVPMYHYGYGCFHQYSVDTNCFTDFSSAANSISILGSHTSAFYDGSTSVQGAVFDGTYSSNYAIDASGGSPGTRRIKANGVQNTAASNVSGLPTCNVANGGLDWLVLDATATTFHSVVAGGSTNVVRVVCDTVAWRIGG